MEYPEIIKYAAKQAKTYGDTEIKKIFAMHVTKKEADAIDNWLVKIKHPLAYEPGTQESRFYQLTKDAMTNKNPGKKWKVSRVQSLVFSKKYFTRSRAKAWAKKHGYCYGLIEETANTWRLRQFSPKKLKKGKIRTFWLRMGLFAVIGEPKTVDKPGTAKRCVYWPGA